MDRTTLGIIAGCLSVLVACDDGKDWASAGYQDGYASTFNTACNIRQSLIHAKWDNPKYAEGYARGSSAASAAIARGGCRR
jgi:hypothetical protein